MATITTRSGKGAALTHQEVDDNFTGLNTELGQKEVASNKGVANGYASLDAAGKVPSAQLPSYVDDVVEVANFASLPGTGETGKIYVTIDTNKTYRWTGSAYIEISASPGSTDSLAEGSTNLYFTQARARASVSASGSLSYNSSTGVFSFSDAVTSVAGRTGAVTLTSSDVGLGSVENKSSATIRGELTSTNVTTALGFTPYNSTNPSGYITSSSSITGNAATATTLATARTIALSGAATGTATSFNGSANITIPVTGLNASNLSAGTVPDARLTGIYSGFSHKIDGSNTVFTTPNSGSTSTSGRTVYGLAEYKSDSSAQVGAIVFIAPSAVYNTMHQLEVQGMLYSQNIFRMTVQGYSYLGATTAWADVRKISFGTVDIQTRWAYTPDGKPCLILGDVGTTWSYPHISIVRAMFSHSGSSDAYCSGWTVAIVTSLTGYQSISSTISDSSLVGSITGNSATATTLATGRTIGMTGDVTWTSASFNGSGNVTGTATLANSGVTAGTYTKVTVDAKGRVTTGASLASADLPTYTGTITSSQVTTALGYTPLSNATSYLPLAGGTMTGAITFAGGQTWPTFNQNTTGSAATLTTGRTIGMTGDVTWTSSSFNGSANVTGTATLANSGVTAGTYTKITVDAKGRATSGTTLSAADIPALTMANIPGAAYKQSVRCATTANITLSGTQTIDGIAVVAGDRVLVKNQTTASQNGIYVVSASTWTRSTDADAADEIGAAVVNVDQGTANGGELWTTTFKTTDTLGTTSMNWYEVLYNTGSWAISVTGSSASCTGNAATATTLQTARTINGVSFNGSANITVADSTKLPLAGGTMTGAITFAAGQTWPTFNQNTTGSAATLTTGRTIGMTGDVTWTSASFNGSANVTGTATLANSGVTAGTYTKVTVDAKGRATSGTTLSASDIPALTMANIPGAAYKQSVRCATTANITLSGTQTIDGVAVVAGDRVLVKNQTTASQNGIYVVSATAWARATDADASDEIGAAMVNIDQGTANGGELWTTTYRTTDTLGTTSMNWYEVVYNTGSWGISVTGSSASCTGNAATATTLATARTLTIGSTGKTFNGSANVSWTLAEIGAISGVTITNDTTTAATRYLTFTSATSGAISAANVSSTKLTFNPSTGDFTAGGNVTAYSDERVKANWRQLDDGFLVKLASVKSGIYDRTDAEITQVGVSAQSLRDVLPHAVIEAENGDFSVAYGNAALVSAVELAKEVVVLKKELDALRRSLGER